MYRRNLLKTLTAASVVGAAGCLGGRAESPTEPTIPSLSITNIETDTATVTVVLTDGDDEIHFWERVAVEPFETGEDGGPRSAGGYEFDEAWLEPRDYRLLANWEEGGETHSNRVADLPLVDKCAHIGVKIDDGIQFTSSDAPCPPSKTSESGG